MTENDIIDKYPNKVRVEALKALRDIDKMSLRAIGNEINA